MAVPEGCRTEICRFVDLAIRLRALPPSNGQTRLVAIDGPGGAGKSTFARRLAQALGHVSIVHTDDFASWDNQFEWWPRLRTEVIDPLGAARPGRYRRYDWVNRELAEWHDVAVAPIVLIEGVGAARREFSDALAAIVWIETAADVRLRRGIERDGDELRSFWEQWVLGENAHFAKDRARDRADLIVDGDPRPGPIDAENEFVVHNADLGGAAPQRRDDGTT